MANKIQIHSPADFELLEADMYANGYVAADHILPAKEEGILKGLGTGVTYAGVDHYVSKRNNGFLNLIKNDKTKRNNTDKCR